MQDVLEVQWKEIYFQAQEYYQKNGNLLVPKRYKANPMLGNWIQNQRRDYKNKKLSKERI